MRMILTSQVLEMKRSGKELSTSSTKSTHDSIILDFDPKVWDNISLVQLVNNCFNDVPANFKKIFGTEFNLPMRVQCEVGPDWGNMEEVNA
jgi:hypothetical protein